MNVKVYKWCAVPECKNTSIKTPNKVFVHVPNNKTVRCKWLKLARRNPNAVVANSSLYFCEDHFDLPNDMENYMEYHVMGSVSQVRMKPGCMPKKFACQPDRNSRISNTTKRPYIAKKRRLMILEVCEQPFEEKSIVTEQSCSEEIASGSSAQQNVEEIHQLRPRALDKSIQEHMCETFRSKQTEVSSVNLMTSPLKPLLHPVSTSPYKIKHAVNFNPSRQSTNEAAQAIPSPSADSSSKTCQNQDNSDSNLSTPDEPKPQDPLKRGTLEQCRFCGEFRKDCIDLTTDHKPYLERYKTSLTVNSLSIELDFNDDTLPKTVCCNCDGKLQEMTDFVKKVIDAQDSLINVAEVVKVEAETEDKDNDCNDDPLELSEVFTHKRKTPEPKQKRKAKQSDNSELIDQHETDDTAQGNSVSNESENTVFTHKGNSVSNESENTVFTHKRKSNVKETAAKRKIFKIDIPIQRKVGHDQSDNFRLIDPQGHNVSNVACEETELITDIKEETINTEDLHEEIHLELEEVDNKPDEAELASNALVYEMSKS